MESIKKCVVFLDLRNFSTITKRLITGKNLVKQSCVNLQYFHSKWCMLEVKLLNNWALQQRLFYSSFPCKTRFKMVIFFFLFSSSSASSLFFVYFFLFPFLLSVQFLINPEIFSNGNLTPDGVKSLSHGLVNHSSSLRWDTVLIDQTE